MRPGTVPALLSLLALGACTPMQWVRPDASPEQLTNDARHCQQEAWREARLGAWHSRPMTPIPYRDASGRVYFARPFDPWGGPFGDPWLEENRLAQFCMRSKGYELRPVEKAAETIQPSPEKASSGKP